MKQLNVQDNFRRLWQETRYTLFFVLLIIVIGVIAGFILPLSLKTQVLTAVFGKFNTILQGAESWWLLSTRIFINNLTVTIFLLLSGFFIIMPIFIIFANGLIVGIFLQLSANLEAFLPGNFSATIISLLPHGIFEIPAIILSAILGINIILKLIFGVKIFSPLSRKQTIIFYGKQFIALVVPLLLIAALMEATVSDYVSNSLNEKNANKYLDAALTTPLPKDFLRQNDCHSLNIIEIKKESSQKLSPMNFTHQLYDQEFLKLIKNTTHVPHWVDYYQCEQSSLKITAYAADQYPLMRVKEDQKNIFQKLDYSVVDTADNTWLVEDRQNLEQKYVMIVKQNEKVLCISWSGEDINILNNLLSLWKNPDQKK